MTPYRFSMLVHSNLVQACDGVIIGEEWHETLRPGSVYGATGLIGRTRGELERVVCLVVRNVGGRKRERAVHDLADLFVRVLAEFEDSVQNVECRCGSRYCGRPLCSEHEECRLDMEMAFECMRVRQPGLANHPSESSAEDGPRGIFPIAGGARRLV